MSRPSSLIPGEGQIHLFRPLIGFGKGASEFVHNLRPLLIHLPAVLGPGIVSPAEVTTTATDKRRHNANYGAILYESPTGVSGGGNHFRIHWGSTAGLKWVLPPLAIDQGLVSSFRIWRRSYHGWEFYSGSGSHSLLGRLPHGVT